uniref:Uncharacterized protein n=1 Tax=viral metagenome TaxID=1070528 RepID=A0A6M3K417_9ZZZZ
MLTDNVPGIVGTLQHRYFPDIASGYRGKVRAGPCTVHCHKSDLLGARDCNSPRRYSVGLLRRTQLIVNIVGSAPDFIQFVAMRTPNLVNDFPVYRPNFSHWTPPDVPL